MSFKLRKLIFANVNIFQGVNTLQIEKTGHNYQRFEPYVILCFFCQFHDY